MIGFWISIAGMTFLAMAILILPVVGWHASKNTILKAILVSLIMAIVAVALYFKLGASQLVMDEQKKITQDVQLETEIKQLGSLENMIVQLKKTLANHPDGHGFFLLGNLYFKTQKFSQANEAFKQANQLTPNQPDILVGYAESLYLTHQSTLTQQAKALLEQALVLQPNQLDALYLLMINANQQKDYPTAIVAGEKLLKQLQPDSEEAKDILNMIAKAQKKVRR